MPRIEMYGTWNDIEMFKKLVDDSKISRLKTILYMLKDSKGIPEELKSDIDFEVSKDVVRLTANKLFSFSNAWRTLNEMILKNFTVGKMIVYLQSVKINYWEYGDKSDKKMIRNFLKKTSKDFPKEKYPFLMHYISQLTVVADSRVSHNNPLRYNRKDIVEWHPMQISKIYEDLTNTYPSAKLNHNILFDKGRFNGHEKTG